MNNREIDALVAEKVMGWSQVYINDYPIANAPEYLYPPSDFAPEEPEIVPHYSIDISAAWQVVEKMIDNESLDFPDFKLENYGFWRALFFDAVQNREHGMDEAMTAPMAICLAALKAKGIEIELDADYGGHA